MQEKCVIKDHEYWKVEWANGETPIPSECKETTLSLMTKEGFNIILELRDDDFGDRPVAFYAYVKPPRDFNHDLFDLRGIIFDSPSVHIFPSGIYGWSYRSWMDASLSRPLASQHRDCFVSGPVQIMNTCRAFIDKIIHHQHKNPNETFQKNLKWMSERCFLRGHESWDVRLEEGETPIFPQWNQRPLCVGTKDGFEITIKFSGEGYPQHFIGSIKLPPHFMLTSWLRENANYEALAISVPTLTIDVLHVEGDCYEWGRNLQRVSVPMQILEEARTIIHAVTRQESVIRMERKRKEMDRIRKELMEETCHPRRIERWAEQGFDPFEEIDLSITMV